MHSNILNSGSQQIKQTQIQFGFQQPLYFQQDPSQNTFSKRSQNQRSNIEKTRHMANQYQNCFGNVQLQQQQSSHKKSRILVSQRSNEQIIQYQPVNMTQAMQGFQKVNQQMKKKQKLLSMPGRTTANFNRQMDAQGYKTTASGFNVNNSVVTR